LAAKKKTGGPSTGGKRVGTNKCSETNVQNGGQGVNKGEKGTGGWVHKKAGRLDEGDRYPRQGKGWGKLQTRVFPPLNRPIRARHKKRKKG